MANSTEEYWTLRTPDGQDISLHQYGWAVTTVGGSRYDLPPRRGSDLTVAYRPGQLHRPKMPDARQINLLMFMVGWDPATGLSPPDQRLQWNDNWDTLRRLVYRHSGMTDQRVTLYRRWWLSPQATFPTTRSNAAQIIQSDPGVPPTTPRLLQAFALAEMTGQMSPTMTGRFRSEFQLDFTLADPYFHGPWVTTTMNVGDYVNVWNDGHDIAGPGYVEVVFTPAAGKILTGPKITNLSTDPNSYVQYGTAVPAGKKLRYVVNKFVAQEVQPDGTTQNVIGNVMNYGARWWLTLLPGANRLHFSAFAGEGTATVSFRPPYV